MTQAAVRDEAPSSVQLSGEKKWSPYWLLLTVALVGLCFVLYRPVLFDFFVSDDYTHVDWLRRAVNNPQLVLKNFYSCWLDVPTARFYRPMISVTLFTDYLIWRENSLGFHLTNVALHAATTVFMFLFMSDVTRRCFGKDRLRTKVLPIAAAVMFATYPIHPEVVSWVTGRVDSVMAMFFLASMWCYTRWRSSSRATWLIAGVLTAALSFASKEMALALPPTLTACEFFIFSEISGFRAKALASLRRTAGFYLILVGYFVVRTLALGTVVGGYDNGLGFVGTWAQQLDFWRRGLQATFIPANFSLVSSKNFFLGAWYITLPLSIVAALYSMKERANRSLALFLLVWATLSILPVYKIFTITSDLQGSRLAYLVTAPLSALLVMGFALVAANLKRLPGKAVCMGLLALQLVASGGLLCRNNKAWVEAGQEINAIRAASSKVLDGVAPAETALFLNLPDNVHGAYVGRNALGGMTNFRPESIAGIGQGDLIGFFKRSIGEDLERIKIFRWTGRAGGFETIDTSRWVLPADKEQNLPLNFNRSSGLSGVMRKQDGAAEFGVGPYAGEVGIDLPQDCWNVDFVRVYFRRMDSNIKDNNIGIRCANQIIPALEVWQPCAANDSLQCATFNLHQNPDWAFGGNCDKMSLLLRADASYHIESVRLTPPSMVIPQIKFGGETFAQSRGILVLKSGKPQTLHVDASNLDGCTDLIVEVTHASRLFADANATEPDTQRLLYGWRRAGSRNDIELRREDFPSTGLYQVRARALQKNGKQVSLSSDPFSLLVE